MSSLNEHVFLLFWIAANGLFPSEVQYLAVIGRDDCFIMFRPSHFRLTLLRSIGLRTLSARRSCRGSVATRRRLLHCLNSLFGAQQRCSFDVLRSASCRESNRNSCSIHVIGHLKDAHDVMLAECQPAVFDFSVELFNSWAYRF